MSSSRGRCRGPPTPAIRSFRPMAAGSASSVGPELCKVAVGGGSPILICRIAGGTPRGASWGDDDFMCWSAQNQPVCFACRRVAVSRRHSPNTDREERRSAWDIHTCCPGARPCCSRCIGNDFLGARIEAVEVATGARKTVIQSGTRPVVRSRDIWCTQSPTPRPMRKPLPRVAAGSAIRCSRVETLGESVAALEGISMGNHRVREVRIVTSRRRGVRSGRNSSLEAAAQRSLCGSTERGGNSDCGAETRTYAIARISPDGTRIALDIRNQTNDIWIWDISRKR